MVLESALGAEVILHVVGKTERTSHLELAFGGFWKINVDIPVLGLLSSVRDPKTPVGRGRHLATPNLKSTLLLLLRGTAASLEYAGPT